MVKISRKGRQFVISDRLKGAYKEVGTEGLREGLAILSAHPDRIIIENLGIGEDQKIQLIPDLTQADQELIDQLARQVSPTRLPLRSVVVRQALEQLILADPALVEFRKPEDWEPQPTHFRQGGKNPVPSLPEPASNVAFSIPLYLYSQVAYLVKPRGRAHEETQDFSGFVRQALDEAELDTLKEFAPVKPALSRKRKIQVARRIVIPIFNRQQSKLNQAILALDNSSASDAIAAMLDQALERQGNAAVNSQAWEYWQVLCRHTNLEDAAEDAGASVEEFTECLVKAGYINLEAPQETRKAHRYSIDDYADYIWKHGVSVQVAAKHFDVSPKTIYAKLGALKVSAYDLRNGRIRIEKGVPVAVEALA